MAVAKVIVEGVTKMDLTSNTVSYHNLLSGYTAKGADGEPVVGAIASKSASDVTVNGATVTIPSGYYSSAFSRAIPYGSATTPATTITANPTITVNAQGLVTATNSKSQNVTPTVVSGYVSTGTAGTITVTGTSSTQLTSRAASTYTPGTTDITIPSGIYLTGTQTIKGDANLVPSNIAKNVTIFSVTGTCEGEDTTVQELQATENGIYTGQNGVAYNPITVAVENMEEELITGGSSDYSYANVEATCVGEYAFARARVTAVSFPACEIISERAFHSASKLSSVYFPICSEIGAYAFAYCSSLRDVYFPQCKAVRVGAFDTNSYVTPSLPLCEVVEQDFIYSNTCSSLELPKLLEIRNLAFRNAKFIEIASYSLCSIIGASAFSSCYRLKSASFPVCSEIGSNAFLNCSALTDLYFPSCETIQPYAFSKCSRLTSVEFPNCTSVGNGAFADCTSLASVSFPVCTFLGLTAFRSCSALTEVVMPSCASILDYTFTGCSALTMVSFPACTSVAQSAGLNNLSQLQSVYFNNLEMVPGGMFSGCYNLTTVSMPHCKRIGDGIRGPFYNCSALTSVAFPECSFITYGFSNCVALSSYSLPACEYLGNYTFAYTAITVASFPLCSRVGYYAFGSCLSLSSVYLPSCQSVDTYAFVSCTALTEINLPSCSYVGTNAFQNCHELRTVSLPMVSSIAGQVFSNCYNLISLYLLGSVVPTVTNHSVAELSRALYSTPIVGYSASAGQFGSIFVRESKYSAFLSYAPWYALRSRIVSLTDAEIEAL